jgi:ubiquinone biosynthesis protein Coq4
MDQITEFKTQIHHVDAATFRADVVSSRGGDLAARQRVAGVLVWAGFSCPDAITSVYDNLTSAWMGKGPEPEIPTGLPEGPLDETFWSEFFRVMEGERGESDALRITAGVAALGASVHESMGEIAENCARNHPGAKAALVNPIPGRTDLNELGRCPENSLGNILYRMVVDQGFDLEVLDRDQIALSELPKCLAYLNTRILQMHDVWHLVAGYQTTGTHEIAISGFQLAQFGHNYSAMFLGMGAALSVLEKPAGFSLFMQLISESWQHGRATTPMMDIAWEDEWTSTLPEIREKYGIEVYRSVLPADLLEVVEGNTGKLHAIKVVLQIMFLRFSGAFPA